ncbi:unnamed protein product [Sphacelaria rigidula]
MGSYAFMGLIRLIRNPLAPLHHSINSTFLHLAPLDFSSLLHFSTPASTVILRVSAVSEFVVLSFVC